MKLTIAHGRAARVSPSGSPAIARTWFSNWLVTAPSMVQCPELCTRGAISLATSRPRRRRTRWPARRHSRSAASTRFMCARVRAPAAAAIRAAGAIVAQDAVVVQFSAERVAWQRRRRGRAPRPAKPRSRTERSPREQRLRRPGPARPLRGPPAVAARRLALAVVAHAARLEHAGQADGRRRRRGRAGRIDRRVGRGRDAEAP